MNQPYYHVSKIKRERMRKMEIQNKIIDMRKNLPVYNLEEIREYKMPYYDALVKNMQENGFISSASFLQELVQFQTQAREEAGPGSNVWMRPQLQFSNKELKYLTEELQKAEQHNESGAHQKECETFLRLGIHFAFGHSDWWWLGEQILIQSINISGNYPLVQGNFEALSRFSYAKFLIQNLREYETAKEQLVLARDLSMDKSQAVGSYFSDERPGTLYMLINYYTHKCLMKEVRNLMASDHRKAIEVAIQAKKRAAESCYREGETQALLMKGLCEMNIDEAKNAIFSFNRTLKLQEFSGNEEGLCKVLIQLAKAYLMDNDTSQSLRVLNRLKETSAQFHLHFYLAQAYKTMGEQYLNNGEYAIARRLLNKSLSYFENEKDASSDIALVQLLEAIAWGLELFPRYVDLVFNSGSTAGPSGIENLNKIINWKDSREPFWDEVHTETSFADMMTADQQIVRPSTVKIEKYKEQRRLEKKAKKQTIEALKKERGKHVVNILEQAVCADSEHDIVDAAADKLELNEAERKNADEENNEENFSNSHEIIELHDNKENFLTATPSFNDTDGIEEKEQTNSLR